MLNIDSLVIVIKMFNIIKDFFDSKTLIYIVAFKLFVELVKDLAFGNFNRTERMKLI